MITYKNLRNINRIYDKKLLEHIITITIDVYDIGRIFKWYKPKFIKTVNLIRVYNVWRDLDDENLPIDNASKVEELYHEYNIKTSKEFFESEIKTAIKNYKQAI